MNGTARDRRPHLEKFLHFPDNFPGRTWQTFAMKTFAPLVIVAVLFSAAHAVRAANPVIVHEWGTFTSLQDEKGNAIGGINVDDEAVPYFVFQIAGTSVVPIRGA